MDFVEIYHKISSSATLFGTLLLIAIALWILAIRKIEKQTRGRK